MHPLCTMNCGNAIAIMSLILMNAAHLVGGQTCGGQLFGSGTFSTPNFPELYPSNLTCMWNLEATAGLAVNLQINGLQVTTFSDVLQLYSGGILVFQFHAANNPFSVVLSRTASVVLISQAGGSRGFSASFTSTAPACGLVCNYNIWCSMWTPNFPLRYAKSSSCNWSVETVPGNNYVLDFTTLDSTPLYGNIGLLSTNNGSITTELLLNNGVPQPPALMVGDNVALSFNSVGCRRSTGFLAQYAAKFPVTCGASISGQGSLTTPGFPGHYPPLAVCLFVLTASPGLHVSLTFSTIDVLYPYDSVRLYSDGVFVDRYSGSYDPFTKVLGSVVTLEFLSNTFASGLGVEASFFSV